MAERDRVGMSSLLDRFIAQATVDDYAHARSSAAEGHSAQAFRGLTVFVATVLVGVVFVAAVLTVRSSAEVRTSTREALLTRITALSAQVTQEQERTAQLADAVEVLRSDVLDDGGDAQRSQQLAQLSARGGTEELNGPGIIVTIDDAPDADAASLNRVLDRDLQDIVNAMWQMGAEGVAVNDQRLTQTSAIRGAGQAILVNYQPLVRPYVVQAVGTSSPQTDGSSLQELLDALGRDYGLVSSMEVGDVALPAGDVHDPRYATTGGTGS